MRPPTGVLDSHTPMNDFRLHPCPRGRRPRRQVPRRARPRRGRDGGGRRGARTAARPARRAQVPLPTALDNAEVVARFLREARAAAKIKSEHVARVIDVGDASRPARRTWSWSTSRAGPRARRSRTHGPLPVELAARYVLQACEAVAEAHARGIVHRDLKPANLFLARRPAAPPVVKVLDFGISKSAVADEPRRSSRGRARCSGSPLYMSPEQMRSAKDVDRAVRHLGAGRHPLRAARPGEAPFDAETMPELCIRSPRPARWLINRAASPRAPPSLVDVVRALPHSFS